MKLTAAKCPSCGADIKVDRSLKFTKCEYCNSRIIVEEAIENLIQVELKDVPTFDNYLKLGNRYWENKEFSEAYQAYSRAVEIEPDNPLVVLRRGLSRSMASDYNHFEITSAISGLKSSISLMKKMSFSRQDIYQSIEETLRVIVVSRDYLLEVYQSHQFTMDQTIGYIERLEACLDGFYYLESVVEKDSLLEQNIVRSIIETIDIILGKVSDANYQLDRSFIKDLKNKRKQYASKVKGELTSNPVISRGKVVSVKDKHSIVFDILCYLMIFFLGIMFLGSIFNHESIFIILLWLLCMISFIPPIKKIFMRRFGVGSGWIMIVVRVILLVIAFLALASGENEFENTYRGEDGVLITLEDGKYTMKDHNTIVEGEYHWDTRDNDFYIHVQGNDNQNYEYRYRNTSDGGSLCLLLNNKCNSIYLPVD